MTTLPEWHERRLPAARELSQASGRMRVYQGHKLYK